MIESPLTSPGLNIPVDLWYGDGDRNPIGPIAAVLVEHRPQAVKRHAREAEHALIEVVDVAWLDDMGLDLDDHYQYECGLLPPDHFVSRDDYAWCPKGGGPPSTRG